MIIYGKTIDEAGERNHLDTNDFVDVFFEKDRFRYVSGNESKTVMSECALEFSEEKQEIYFVTSVTIEGKAYTSNVVLDAEELVDQGYETVTKNTLLDEAEIIKDAKRRTAGAVKREILKAGILLQGTTLDVLGLIKCNGDIVGAVDDIIIADDNTFEVERYYTIVDAASLQGTLEIYVSDNKVIRATIQQVAENNGKMVLTVAEIETSECDNVPEYEPSSSFSTAEEYQQDRAQYISVGGSNDIDAFDDYDDLF